MKFRQELMVLLYISILVYRSNLALRATMEKLWIRILYSF